MPVSVNPLHRATSVRVERPDRRLVASVTSVTPMIEGHADHAAHCLDTVVWPRAKHPSVLGGWPAVLSRLGNALRQGWVTDTQLDEASGRR